MCHIFISYVPTVEIIVEADGEQEDDDDDEEEFEEEDDIEDEESENLTRNLNESQ